MDSHKIEPNPALYRAPNRGRWTAITSRWRLAFWVIVGLLAIGLLIWIIRPAQQTQPGGRFGMGAPMAVATATAQTGDIRVILNELGTVTPLATVTVKTQINGQLQKIAFQEGQTVQKGDFLAQVDPRPYQAALEQAEGTLQHDQANLKNAQVDLERYRKLVAEDSIATQTLDTQQALVRQLEGTITTDQAQVDNAKLNLAYCHIVSPVAGRVGLRQVDQGNYVSVGDVNGIVVVTQLQPITVIFTVPEDNLPAIMKQMHAGAKLAATSFDKNGATQLAVGTVTTVDNQIDTTTGTVKLRAQFDNQDEMLFPNQFVRIQLLVDTLHGQTVVPIAAVQHGAPGTYVYLAKPDSTVAMTPVKLGVTDGESVGIDSGVAPGDVVVTEGADRLRDGAAITLPGADPAAEPGNSRRKGAGGKRGPGAAGQPGAQPGARPPAQ